MGLKHCKLEVREQRRPFEFFVLEVTTCAAADLLDIQANTASIILS
jgi:hypothetical protein